MVSKASTSHFYWYTAVPLTLLYQLLVFCSLSFMGLLDPIFLGCSQLNNQYLLEASDSKTTSGPSDVVIMVSGNLSFLPQFTAAASCYNE